MSPAEKIETDEDLLGTLTEELRSLLIIFTLPLRLTFPSITELLTKLDDFDEEGLDVREFKLRASSC
jgi:hypothetical protein